MIRINQIRIKAGQAESAAECNALKGGALRGDALGSDALGRERKLLENKIRKQLRLKENETFAFEIVKRSVDARKKPDIFYSYTVDVGGLKEKDVVKRIKGGQISLAEPVQYRFPAHGTKSMRYRPVIVGTGPAGLFCGYMLAIHGYRPILLERGMEVGQRCRQVEKFWKTGRLDEECNVQFGEGGAGTFSDGKLNTLVKDKDGRNKEVLSIFVSAGAPEHILYDGKPHIGTDILAKVVKNMRKVILENGGEMRFDTKMTDLYIEGGKIKGLGIRKRLLGETGREECFVEERIETDMLVLAIGHSARDTFEMLYRKGVPMEAKPFAVGLRVEHPQNLINRSQYGAEYSKCLPPASYKVTAQTKAGRGVYSFCMCPGGYVVNASSEEGRLAVNGMSYSGREGENANSAIIISVNAEDYGSAGPLGGIEFQRMLEKKAYEIGEGCIPVEYYGDFKRAVLEKMENPTVVRRDSENSRKREDDSNGQDGEGAFDGQFSPRIKGMWKFGKVHDMMPDALNQAFMEGMEDFNRKIPGFAAEKVILSGIESRTSSPVRIHRDGKGESKIAGLYPCGEGAGYAGGIMSAAMDGIRMAEQIAKEYKALERQGSPCPQNNDI